VQLLSLEIYREEILTGFVISAGGLGESLVSYAYISHKLISQTRAASVALADYLDSLPEQDLIAILKSIENILRINLQNDRVVIPALETLAGLFEENIFSRLEGSYKFIPVGFVG
jgi:tubulin-specific chaperone D